MHSEDELIAVIESHDCIYELIQGPTHHKYEAQLYDALAKAVYESKWNNHPT